MYIVPAKILLLLNWKNWLVVCLKIWRKIDCWLTWKTSLFSHCLKNPEILLVMLIGPLLIRSDCVYHTWGVLLSHFYRVCFLWIWNFDVDLKWIICPLQVYSSFSAPDVMLVLLILFHTKIFHRSYIL